MRALVVIVVGGDGVALISAGDVAVGPCPFVAQRGEREGGCVYSPGLSNAGACRCRRWWWWGFGVGIR
jgi:hypothetical protein